MGQAPDDLHAGSFRIQRFVFDDLARQVIRDDIGNVENTVSTCGKNGGMMIGREEGWADYIGLR